MSATERRSRPHPPYCRHCKMVQEYRDQRAAELEAYWNPSTHDGGWRDPHAWGRIITFKRWLQHYRYEQPPAEEQTVKLTTYREALDRWADRAEADDFTIQEGRRLILNRIDEEWGCDQVVWMDSNAGPVYCGLPEWEPFSRRCYDHTPGNMTSLGG